MTLFFFWSRWDKGRYGPLCRKKVSADSEDIEIIKAVMDAGFFCEEYLGLI